MLKDKRLYNTDFLWKNRFLLYIYSYIREIFMEMQQIRYFLAVCDQAALHTLRNSLMSRNRL